MGEGSAQLSPVHPRLNPRLKLLEREGEGSAQISSAAQTRGREGRLRADGTILTLTLALTLTLTLTQADSELMALTAEHELALAQSFKRLGVTR